MIAHPFELHGGSHQVELVQTGNIAVEGFLGTWLESLVHQGVIDPLGTFADNFLQYGKVNAFQQ